MTYCGEQTLVKWNPTERQAVSLRCKAWTCPDCSPDRKRQLIAQGHRGKPNTFITLTCRRGQLPTPNEAAAALSRAWRLVHKRALREAKRDPDKTPTPAGQEPADGWPRDKQGRVQRQVRLINGKLDYLVVIEAHQSGWPHLHILCRSTWIAHTWLRAQMAELLNSPRIDVQRVTKASQVAGYVTKYCSGCDHKFGTTKRYWQSQSYPLTKYERKAAEDRHWYEVYRATEQIRHIAALWTHQGWSLEWKSTYKLSARAPPCQENTTGVTYAELSQASL